MKQEYVAPGSIVVVYEGDQEPAKYCRSVRNNICNVHLLYYLTLGSMRESPTNIGSFLSLLNFLKQRLYFILEETNSLAAENVQNI